LKGINKGANKRFTTGDRRAKRRVYCAVARLVEKRERGRAASAAPKVGRSRDKSALAFSAQDRA